MYTHENFANDVSRAFEFLVSEYGMRADPIHIAGPGSWWLSFSGPAAGVTVEHEIGGTCGVTVRNPRHVKADPLDRSEFDLEEIVAVSGNRPQRRQDPRSMSEAVNRAAETLRTTGGKVLRGDFEALHARQSKMAAALRLHNVKALDQ